ncbi:MAG: hypothetical protein LQ352_001592 [Teloschistes flavicans]|nr:MAG: hypothetical protein LQ352_001592 [Teloschistes flavicans]
MAKFSHQKPPKGTLSSANDNISDPRFANIQTDPRFRLPSKRNTHVQIDKRFERMLRDESFSRRAKVDRYGRRLPQEAGKKELERYYRIEDHDDTSEQDEEVKLELARANVQDEDKLSSSAEESSSEESEVEELEEDDVFGLLDNHIAEGGDVPLGEITSRLAVVNLDWDNIRAEDLMAVFSSFVSAGQIRRISVYPSEFGKERIEREEIEGPSRDIFARRKASNGNEEGDSSSEDQHSGIEEDDEKIKKTLLQEGNDQDFNSAKLRRYQLERLRYYYAVLICSSPAITQTIYEAVDGTEYLTTANFFDLRFIPDNVDFTQDKPRDECTRIPDGYRPNEFVTDALQHSKVRLTWDADDITRKGAQKRAFAASRANIDENDLKAYLGSDSSDPEDDAPEPIVVDATASTVPESENQAATSASSSLAPTLSKKEAERQRMRSLLGLSSDPKHASDKQRSKSNAAAPVVGDMQITFSSGLNPEPNTSSVFANSPNDDNEPGETTVEKYVRKEKERKARRKAKLKASREGNAIAPEQDQERNDGGGDDDGRKGNDGDDLGFDDPFFTSSGTPSKPTAGDRKEARRLKKAERAAEEARAAAQRAELELLTLPDDDPDAGGEGGLAGRRHFDMKEILKAEKAAAKKKGTKGRGSRRKDRVEETEEGEDEEGRRRDDDDDDDRFKVDVQDPRFAVVYERPEFAIDPSHPRFLKTAGTRALLEEGRRKRKVGEEEADREADAARWGERKGKKGRKRR